MKLRIVLLILIITINLLGEQKLLQQLNLLQRSLQKLHQELNQANQATQDFLQLPSEIVEQIIFQTFPEKIVFKSELLETLKNLEKLYLLNKSMSAFINDDFDVIAKEIKKKIINPNLNASLFINEKLTPLLDRFVKKYLTINEKEFVTINNTLAIRQILKDYDLNKIVVGFDKGHQLTPLGFVIQYVPYLVTEALEKGANPNEEWAGKAPLYLAIDVNLSQEGVKSLIDSGANILLPIEGDYTLLTKLITEATLGFHAQYQLSKLKSLGIDFNQPDGFNNLPIYIAYSLQKNNFQQALKDFVDINARDRKGRTTLMKLALDGKLVPVKKFLLNNPDTTLQDNDGYTAVQLARQKGYDELANLIEAHKSH